MRTFLITLLGLSLGAGVLVAEGQNQPKPKAKGKAKAAAKQKDEGPQLPELTDTAATNAYAFYSHPSFDFVLDRHMHGTFFLKDKGERTGKPVKLSAPQFAVPNAKNPPKASAKIVEFTDPPPPKAQAAEFEISGKASNGGAFTVKYKFAASSLAISGAVRGGEGALPLVFELNFPTTHTFTPNIEMADRKKAVEGWYIKTREKGDKDKNFKSYTYTYWDLAKFKKDAQNAEVYGPWGTRKFLIRTTGSGESDLSLEGGRGHRYPYSGFDCLFKLPSNAKKKAEVALNITIE